jgi:hypothetical protein
MIVKLRSVQLVDHSKSFNKWFFFLLLAPTKFPQLKTMVKKISRGQEAAT